MMLGLLVSVANGMPFDGCTFYTSRLAPFAWPEPGEEGSGCANYKIEEGACTKTKMVAGAPVSYPGDRVSGRSPEYLIEVTPHFGRSVFAESSDGGALQRQLDRAAEFWKSEKGMSGFSDMLFGGTNRASVRDGEESVLLHARVVRTPFGVTSWAWPQIGVVAAGAPAVPTCFLGLSEHSPAVWSDVPGHAEESLALLFNGMNVCNVPGLAQLNNRIDPPGLRPFEPCSRGVRRSAVRIGNALPDSEVVDAFVNPMLSCAGRHGPLFPRSGWVTTGNDELSNAEKVGYKFASLARDHFTSGPGVEAGDRWQIVWPPAGNLEQARCFVPGAERPLAEISRSVSLPMVPMTDGPGRENGSVVIAVWRKWSKCVEPGVGSSWRGILASTREARVEACKADGALPWED